MLRTQVRLFRLTKRGDQNETEAAHPPRGHRPGDDDVRRTAPDFSRALRRLLGLALAQLGAEH
eukprot:2951006-Pyramimonas_sp.AAC.1